MLRVNAKLARSTTRSACLVAKQGVGLHGKSADAIMADLLQTRAQVFLILFKTFSIA